MARASKLKWVQATQAGIDALEGSGVLESQVLLTTASGIHATPVGEYVLTAMLALAKQVTRLVEGKQGKRWDRFNLSELHGKTVGIVGLGNIGHAVARLCKAFDMRVIAVRRSAIAEQLPTPDVDEVRAKEALRWLLQESDFVVLCVPLTSETTYLIGAEELEAMKPSAYLINVARGSVVEEKALIAALKEGRIAGAGLDVFTQEPLPPESELWELPNVFLSAHIAGLSEQYDTRVTQLFCENLRRYLAGQELLNLVDRSMGY
jgi:phosphoglycerate dehydrogenase-like enzyme